MKPKILIIIFSKILLDFTFIANAQESGSLSAMKDSFPAYVKECGGENQLTASCEYPIPDPEVIADDANIASSVSSNLTKQVLRKLNNQRVRVVSTKEQKENGKKKRAVSEESDAQQVSDH